MWKQSEAIDLCRRIEKICPPYGCHVALTGGCLYKDGQRKDCDLIFYRIRQAPEIQMAGLWSALEEIGVIKRSGFGWCFKCEYAGKSVDCLFPEEQNGDYATDN